MKTKNVILTSETVSKLLTEHKMEGQIETGYRYWLRDFFSPVLTTEATKDQVALIEDIIHNTEDMGVMSATFKTAAELEQHIVLSVGKIMKEYFRRTGQLTL